MTEQSPTFCRLAWTNVTTTQHGSCKLCSTVADDRTIMDWSDEPRPMNWSVDGIESIWNGSYMQDVRRKMLAGEQVYDCEPCYSAEAMGNASSRMAANDDQVYDVASGGYGIVAKHLPIRLELRLSNRCNLACHSCWGGGSSPIHDLRKTALGMNDDSTLVMPAWLRWGWKGEINGLAKKKLWYSTSEDYVSQPGGLENFAKMADTVRKLYITGGEPTMDGSINAYLDEMKIRNNGCHVGWSTNCTIWNEPLMERMGHFLYNEVQLSVDAIGEAGEYIRRPSVWSDVNDNMRRYMMDDRVRDLKVFTVVGAMNAGVLLDLIDHIRHLSAETGRRVVWWPIPLKHPEHQDIRALRGEDRRSIADAMEGYLSRHGEQDGNLDFAEGLRGVISQLRVDAESPNLRRQLVEYLDYSDRLDEAVTGVRRRWRESLPHLRIE